MDSRISVTDCAEIALEMTNVDRIKPNLKDPTPKNILENDFVQNAIVIKKI